jgi:hypothetical protein
VTMTESFRQEDLGARVPGVPGVVKHRGQSFREGQDSSFLGMTYLQGELGA